MTRWLRLIGLSLVCLALPAVAHAQWDTPNRAFHKATAFPLDGRHLAVPCASCHVNGVTKGTPKTCESCHWERRQDDIYRLRLGAACGQCHKTSSWTAVRWNHTATAGMALGAAHRTVACASCHKNGQFAGTRISCVDCHQQDFDATRAPDHRAAGFSTACESCHKVSDTLFTQSRFNHAAIFPLAGLHALQSCTTCHAGAKYKGTPRDCYGCHRPQDDQTRNPNHATAGYSTTCEGCHKNTDSTWNQATINHSQFYPLVGLHATASCATCHVNNVYKGTSRICYACHKTDYDQTKNPSHVASGFNTTCESCHKNSDSSWTLGKFSHPDFPITSGKHAGIACATCHTNAASYATFSCFTGCHNKTTTDNQHKGRTGYQYVSTACYSCHPNGKS